MALVVIIAASLCGCVTLPPNSPRSPKDPWESWNRGVYKFNDALDRAIAKPVARAYVHVVPHPVRTGVSNFFSNLHTTTVMVNDFLQGKFMAAANDLGRLALNTTVGVGGLLDPATSAGLDRNDEDFGLTLGHWGVPAGPFFELPLLGPSSVRDAPAKVADVYTNPTHYLHDPYVEYSLTLVDLVDKRAALLSLDETLKRVYDPYAFVRDAYLANRAYRITGKESEEPLVDPEADVPAEPGAPRKPDAPSQDGTPPQ
jgi:phospholipid-binding lipoprotein MlaA